MKRCFVFLFLIGCVSHRNDNQHNVGDTPNQEDPNNPNSEPASSSSDNDAGIADVSVPPTPTDGVKNGDETDVDCGGKSAPKCDLNKSCNQHDDCGSGVCNYKHTCIPWAERSCAAYYGGNTCGAGEVGDPTAKHESCCTTDTLPTGVKLDRYKITAGRARALVDRVGGNFKIWYTTNRKNLNPETQAQIDPFVDTLPEDMRKGDYSVVAQVNGGNIYLKDLPSAQQGCYEAPGAAGTHTYWLTPEDNALFGDTNGYDQNVLDTKPLNCAPYIFFAALCAYDGGRLQTFKEAQMAYGTATYPWGELPNAGGFGAAGVVGPASGTGWGPDDPACPTCDTNFMNWTNNYQWPDPKLNPKISFDYSYFISAPGRFQKDRGPYGHFDVGGNLIEWTSSVVQDYVDEKGRGSYIRLSGAGSFEGHQANYWKWAMPQLTKYGKFGGRCVKY